MPLMSVAVWQQKTSKVGKDRTNPLITDIDILLDEYHKAGKTDVQKLKLVILIRRYCREWLSEKDEKETSFRKKYVDRLFTETSDELAEPQVQQAIQQMLAGKQTPGLKQMVEHPVELLQPRATAKEKWNLNADINLSRVSAPIAESGWKKYHPGATAMDHANIADVLDNVQDQQKKEKLQRSLDYLQKKDRLKCELALGPDSLLRRGDSTNPYSTQGTEMYAIDDMQKIYTQPPKKQGEFHHSSFLSGRPVFCAGEIELKQGKITYIDNLSGHYKPTTQHLLDCVQLLKRTYGVDYLPKIGIKDMAQPSNVWNSALDFLRYNGQPPRPLPTPPVKS